MPYVGEQNRIESFAGTQNILPNKVSDADSSQLGRAALPHEHVDGFVAANSNEDVLRFHSPVICDKRVRHEARWLRPRAQQPATSCLSSGW